MDYGRQDYNDSESLELLIPQDEPVFLLRGQDKIAPMVIRFWASQVLDSGGSPQIVASALKQVDKMIKWQNEHINKIPDTNK